MTLSTIIYFVFDLSLLKSFYCTNFGLAILEESRGWVLLKAGNVELGLHQIPGGSYEPSAEETNVKLVFDTEENLEQIKKRFEENRIDVGDIKDWDGYPYFVLDGKDPEGNVFQIRKKK